MPADPRSALKGKVGVPSTPPSNAVPLREIKAIGHAIGGTVNDVLVSAVAGALRAQLARRQDKAEEIRAWSRWTCAARTTPSRWATARPPVPDAAIATPTRRTGCGAQAPHDPPEEVAGRRGGPGHPARHGRRGDGGGAPGAGAVRAQGVAGAHQRPRAAAAALPGRAAHPRARLLGAAAGRARPGRVDLQLQRRGAGGRGLRRARHARPRDLRGRLPPRARGAARKFGDPLLKRRGPSGPRPSRCPCRGGMPPAERHEGVRLSPEYPEPAPRSPGRPGRHPRGARPYPPRVPGAPAPPVGGGGLAARLEAGPLAG
jgi:hypothetical protein